MLKQGEGVGCAVALAILNLVLMGIVAVSFSQGPYSSLEQEQWYRHRSLAFLVLGAIVPFAVLYIGRKNPLTVAATTIWMAGALLLFVGYVMYSGGGV